MPIHLTTESVIPARDFLRQRQEGTLPQVAPRITRKSSMEESGVKIPVLHLTLRIARHSSLCDTSNESLFELRLHIIIAYADPVKKVTPEIHPP